MSAKKVLIHRLPSLFTVAPAASVWPTSRHQLSLMSCRLAGYEDANVSKVRIQLRNSTDHVVFKTRPAPDVGRGTRRILNQDAALYH